MRANSVTMAGEQILSGLRGEKALEERISLMPDRNLGARRTSSLSCSSTSSSSSSESMFLSISVSGASRSRHRKQKMYSRAWTRA